MKLRRFSGRYPFFNVPLTGDCPDVGLLMEKSAAMPAVLIRGYRLTPADVGSESLKRPADADLSR